MSKLLALLCLGLLSLSGRVYAQEVRVGIYENEPKIFTDANGIPSGILIDVLKVIADKEGWQLGYVPCEWDSCLKKLESGAIDLMPDMAYATERERRFDFHTTPALHSWSQIYRSKNVAIASVLDLKGKRVALLEGGIQEEAFTTLMQGFSVNTEIIRTKTLEEAFQLAQSGKADAAVANHYYGDLHKANFKLLETPIIFQPSRLFYATAQGRHPELLNSIEKYLAEWQKNPDSPYFEIVKRWGGHVPPAFIPPVWWKVLFAVTGLMLLFLLGMAILRKQVMSRTQELQSNLTLLSMAGQLAKIGGWSVKLPEMTLIWSDEVCAIHEAPPGTHPTVAEATNFYAPEDRQHMKEVIDKCIQNGAPFDEEFRIITAKGNRRWTRIIGQAIRDEHGVITRIQGAFQDISNLKRAEEERLANLERYQLLFQSLTSAFGLHEIICDAAGKPVDYRFLEVNPAFETLTGLKAADLIGRTALDAIPTLEAFWIERYGAVALNGKTARFEYFVPEMGRHFEVVAYSPKHGQFVTLFSDVTARNQMESMLIENERKYRELTESINDAIWTLDAESLRFTYVSPSVFKLRGYTPEEIMAEPMDAALTPEGATHIRSQIARGVEEYLAGKRTADQFNTEEIELRRKDGSLVWTEVVTNFYRNEHTGKIEIRGVTRDINERKRMEESLRKLSLAVEQSPNSIVITDLDGNIEFVNLAFTKITGYTLNEVIGKNPRILRSGKTPRATYNELWAQLTRGETWKGELINRHKDGTEIVESVLISPVRRADGQVTNYLAIKNDITEIKKTQAHIDKLAHFDQLTSLPNRTLLKARFDYALSLAQRSHENMTVMFLDLDHFKDVNDTLGHSVGDQLLMEVAKRLKAMLRDQDILARQGGDEFVLILPGADENGAALVASKIIETVSRPYQIEEQELIATPSIGIAIYPHDGEDFETLSKNADTAMYRVKQEGRNDFRFFTSEMQTHSARALKLGNALRHAVSRNQLQMHYQPQLSIQDGHVVGAEALLRWTHPELGAISPAEFIPIAENSGQIIAIGEWVLRTVARQLKAWIDSGLPPMVIAVNLSAIQFRQPNLPELVTGILGEVGLPHEYLELELTEAVAMDDPQGAVAMMDKLSACGIRMSIDDFGTGYSSLSYLKRFKVYKLKIDQSFVRDITDDPDDKAIVSAIINMASSLGMQTIAEGVETSGQLAFLRLQGCDEVQGYYFSKPLPAEQFELFVRKA